MSAFEAFLLQYSIKLLTKILLIVTTIFFFYEKRDFCFRIYFAESAMSIQVVVLPSVSLMK